MHVVISAVNRFTRPSGLCRFTANLARSLATAHAVKQVTIIVGAWQVDHFRHCFGLEGDKIIVSVSDCDNNTRSRYLWYYFGLPQLLRILRPDLLQLAFPMPFLRSRIDVPIVTTVHDLYSFDVPQTIGFPNILLNRYVLGRAVEDSTAVVSISRFTESRLRAHLGRKLDSARARVIYQCVLKPKSGVTDRRIIDHPYFLSVAQHWKHKNLDIVIAAMHRLLQHGAIGPQTSLVIVGAEGPSTAHLLSMVSALEMEDRVNFLYSVTDSELALLYANSEALIVASSIEGFCLPVVEARFCGARVICSDIPVLREIGDASTRFFRLSSNAVTELAFAMERALQQPKPCSTVFQQRFSMTQCRDNYVQLYEELLLIRP